MDILELVELIEQIEKLYRNIYPRDDSKRNIKYVSFRLDTRDMQTYYVSFREWFTKEEVSFTLHSAKDIIKIYNWLNKEEE